MSARAVGRTRGAISIVPLAVVSVAWTVQLAAPGRFADVSLEGSGLPHGGAVPTQALEDPASFTVPGHLGLRVRPRDAADVVQASSTSGIPSAALAAYQRAETVINAADKACNIDWQLIAAIGRVESDHGRYGGSTLDPEGVPRPGIYGIPLDGTNQTQAISDTDAGQHDRDKVWDRAVGPMQFIPSTWSVVGVDADGDGQRNPQDIDDSALAASAYLCAGNDDLGTVAGQRAAVFRYNHSQEYVDLVLAVREAYLRGDYTAVPNYTATAVAFQPEAGRAPTPRQGSGKPARSTTGGRARTGASGSTPSAGSSVAGSQAGGPQAPGSSSSEDGSPDTGGRDEGGVTSGLSEQVEKAVQDTVRPVRDATEGVTRAVAPVLSLAEAAVQCTAAGYSVLLTPAKWQTCIDELTD